MLALAESRRKHQTFQIGTNSFSPTFLQRDAASADARETIARTINRGKASGRLVPITYLLTVSEVYNNDVKLSYEMNGETIDLSNFRRKGEMISEVRFQSDCGRHVSVNP